MTNEEAIVMQKAIKAGLHETGKDHPYRDDMIPLMKESCDMAIEALEEQKVGKWIRESKELSHCSECGQQIFTVQNWFKRCPACGAKMESEE